VRTFGCAATSFVVCLSLGCGGALPSSPLTAGPIDLRSGRYRLDLYGYAISFDPAIPPCENPYLQSGRLAARVEVDLTRASNQWVARTPRLIGDLELRLSAKDAGPAQSNLTGLISGSAPDMIDPAPFPPAGRVHIRGETQGRWATLDGWTLPSGSFSSGKVFGDIRFSDSSGMNVSRCEAITWTLQPL